MVQQLSLFDELTTDDFANVICNEFNKLNTVWKGTFKVTEVELSKWEHIDDKEKVLSVVIKPELNGNYLVQFNGDKESQRTVYNACCFSPILERLEKDRDFAVCVTPWLICIYYHKYERKNLSWLEGVT